MTTNPDSGNPRARCRLNGDREKVSRSFIVLALCWTIFIAGFCFWEYRQARSVALELARTETRSTFNKDLVYRRWATRHGGVYVPITPETPPNPYLAHIPHRDLTTLSGKKLTLMNPAYMTRQVHELSKDQYGVQGHITSLKPIRPGNAPDAWEERALKAFETGIGEVSSLEMMEGELHMRLMRPMVAETGCLKCHAGQGYKVGDIRGGISVSVPWKHYQEVTRDQLRAVYAGLGIVWAIGLAGLWITQSRIRCSVHLRQAAEKTLAERNQFIESIIDLSPDMLYIYDLIARKNIYVNDGIQRSLGYSSEEVRSMGDQMIGGLMHPDDLEAYGKQLLPRYAQARDNELIRHQYRMKHKNGQWRWLDCSELIYARESDGSPRRILGVAHDITEYKKAEAALHESESGLREAQRVAQIGSWDWDVANNVLRWSDEYYRIYNIDQKLPTPNYLDHLKVYTRKSGERLDAAVKQAMETGAPYELELELADPGAKTRWVLARGEVKRDERGRSAGLRGTAQNITERKLAEEQQQRTADRILRQREVLSRIALSPWINEGHVAKAAREIVELVASAFAIGRVSVWLFNEDGAELVCLDLYDASIHKHSIGAVLFEQQFRNEFQAVRSVRCAAINEPMTDARTAGYAGSYLKPRGITSLLLSSIISGDKYLGVLCFEHVDQPHHWEQNEISFAIQLADQIGMAVLNRDRRRAEEALRESKELFSLFMRYSPIYAYIKEVSPVESRVLQASDNFHQMIGISGSDMTGKTMAELFSPEFAAKITADDWAVVAGGGVLKLDEELNGRMYTTIKFPLAQKERTLLAGYTIDITERKLAEEQIQRSLKEKEVLLKEIHHRVKNNMQVICSLLNLQARGIADSTIRAMFEDARNIVKSMALIHEKLYQSKDLAHIDFREYLQNLAIGIADTYKRHDVLLSVDTGHLVLDVNIGIPCGLIVNELVSNSLKYAFPAGRRGTISISIGKNSDGSCVLTVADNGIGFPAALDFRNTSSLGLQLVTVLTGQIHGTIELEKKEGTMFRITFPGSSEQKAKDS